MESENGIHDWITGSQADAIAPFRALTFAAGLFAGSWVAVQSIPGATLEPEADVSKLSAILGGCVMVFGARLAGGCPSGHGITGMSQFSIASIITMAATFGGGICLAMQLR